MRSKPASRATEFAFLDRSEMDIGITHEALMKICIAAMALSLLSLAGFAQTSESQSGKGQLKGACSADVQKFCADAPRGKGQVRGCLASHQGELSETCKAAMAARTKN